ncbi:MAG: hypothetical protein ACE5IY_14540 [bacterium]
MIIRQASKAYYIKQDIDTLTRKTAAAVIRIATMTTSMVASQS